jgi:predicted membrane channel-forming protein YqfA (hemolysin III family)
MDSRPRSVSVTYGFIILNICIWFALGIIIAFNFHPAMPDQPLVKGVMAILAIAAAGTLLGIFIFLQKHSRLAYYLALAFFCVSSLLTIFDDVGLVDLAALVFSVIPLVLLIKDRGWYLQPQPHAVHG